MVASEPQDRTAAVAIGGLYRAYGESWALIDVSLELPAGETLAVVGPNGAGKSTLLRVIAGLLRPSEGEVAVFGAELPREAWRIRHRVGYLAHHSLLYRELTAAENLRFHASLFGLGEAGERRAEELLDRVGLAHRRGTRVGEMSAGMEKRLAICRALLHEPDLLLLDEPLANLDPAGAEAVGELLGPAPGRSRVIVTHDLEAAHAESRWMLGLRRDGSVAFFGPTAGLDPAEAGRLFADPAREAV